MATNKRLRSALLQKLSVTPQRLSQRVGQIKRLYGPMTTEEGTYVLAHVEGFDLSKYLDHSMVDRVRSLIPAGPPATASTKIVPKRSKAPKVRPVRIGARAEEVDALLPDAIANDARQMAEVYPYLYVLENSLRSVIARVMRAAHGSGWWTRCVPKDVRSRVDGRRLAEDKKPWHGKRGAHEIYYSDFGDLRRIIENNWAEFASLFPNRGWITQRLEELEPPRNVVAHHNPISKNDQKRIELYFADSISLLNARHDVIP